MILRGPAYLVQVFTIGAFHLICQFPRTAVGSRHDKYFSAFLTFDLLLHGLHRKESPRSATFYVGERYNYVNVALRNVAGRHFMRFYCSWPRQRKRHISAERRNASV